MGRGDEPGLAAVGLAHHAALDQLLREMVVEGVVACLPVPVIVGRGLAEEQAAHAVMPGEAVGHAAGREDATDAFLHRLAIGGDVGQRRRVAQDRQRLLRRGQAHGLGRIGAAMGDAAAVVAHQILAPADAGDGIAVGHRLGHGADVGLDAIELLGAALGDAEAGLHLVHDHQHVIFGAELAHRLDELGLGGNAAAIAEDRLDQHRGDGVAVLLQHILEAVGVVVGHLPEELAHELGNALAVADDIGALHRVGHIGHVGRPHGGVEQAVIAALEGDVMVPSGGAARQAERRHDRLGAGVGEAHQLGRRHHLGDHLGDHDLALGAEREDGADILALAGGGIDLGMAVAEDRRAVAQAVVDVAIVVEVPETSAPTALDIDGFPFAPEAEVGADSQGHGFDCSLEVGRGFVELVGRFNPPGRGVHDPLRSDRPLASPLWHRRAPIIDKGHCLNGCISFIPIFIKNVYMSE